ncbi:uncharacterized protein N7483_001201 [Penicillium malachiteum]|uniref:uncharacterized protein n=1 Tax=Penicillium malachiteum TaxID=1324776 RepID=UPI0025494C02|nr:uncharacterized protein N7483_001201 [Penicillium malachiteum]KAJ5736076.1 hypothetical protein N7483_001201 [Penicillium malachiteum]
MMDEVIEYVLDSISYLPIMQVLAGSLAIFTLYICARINGTSESRIKYYYRIGLFSGLGLLLLLINLAFFSHGYIVEVDFGNPPTVALLVLGFAVFWFFVGAFFFNQEHESRKFVSDADISRLHRARTKESADDLNERIRTELEIEFLEEMLRTRREKLEGLK